jgi:hypothetical protein
MKKREKSERDGRIARVEFEPASSEQGAVLPRERSTAASAQPSPSKQQSIRTSRQEQEGAAAGERTAAESEFV